MTSSSSASPSEAGGVALVGVASNGDHAQLFTSHPVFVSKPQSASVVEGEGADFPSRHSDVTVDTNCGQSSPRCVGDQLAKWTEMSRQGPACVADDASLPCSLPSSSSNSEPGVNTAVKPQKPVKPKSLWSMTRSRDFAVGDDMTVPQTELTAQCCKTASQSRQHSADDIGQTSPPSNSEQQVPWTTTSPQLISSAVSTSITYQNSNVNGETSPGRSRPRFADEQQHEWTTVSTETASQSSDIILPSDNGVTICGQSSPRCVGDELAQWTETSRETSVSVDADVGERIEPPVIYDLLPDNVHVRRGETLQLVAQFTAFPVPEITWYRANELLTPGEDASRNRHVSLSQCLSVCLSFCLSVPLPT